MKKIITLFLSLLLLCSMSMTAFANEATIETIVPDSHTITVTADGADVFCNGESGNLFTVERLSEPTLLIRAASGKEITKIQLNGENITAKVEGGYYTLEPIYEDKTLTVETKDAPTAQGETYTLQGTVIRNGQPVKDITMELRSTLKTDVTDKDGKFSFSNVECGKHSLTAIENGKIVGYVEFVLTEGSEVNMSLSDGVYTLTVNKNDIGINLTLNLSDDDTMNIASVTGIKTDEKPGGGNQIDTSDTNETNGSNGSNNSNGSNISNGSNGSNSTNDTNGTTDANVPQTGDCGNIPFWFMLLLMSFTIIASYAFYGKKRKISK